jgi:hypothetical protein
MSFKTLLNNNLIVCGCEIKQFSNQKQELLKQIPLTAVTNCTAKYYFKL